MLARECHAWPQAREHVSSAFWHQAGPWTLTLAQDGGSPCRKKPWHVAASFQVTMHFHLCSQALMAFDEDD